MKDLFVVDGYNIIFAWPSLQSLARESLEHAREKLIDILASYGKSKGYMLVLVFDAMYTAVSYTHLTLPTSGMV